MERNHGVIANGFLKSSPVFGVRFRISTFLSHRGSRFPVQYRKPLPRERGRSFSSADQAGLELIHRELGRLAGFDCHKRPVTNSLSRSRKLLTLPGSNFSSPPSAARYTTGPCLFHHSNPAPTPAEWHFLQILPYDWENPPVV